MNYIKFSTNILLIFSMLFGLLAIVMIIGQWENVTADISYYDCLIPGILGVLAGNALAHVRKKINELEEKLNKKD